MMKLPIYKITIDPEYSDGEDLGISQIAFTANPAIKVKGMAFSSQEKKYFADDIKMRIAAPALIPMEIYRCDEDGEYYAEFTEDEIQKLTSKFMQNLTNKGKFNLEHNDTTTVPAYILEAWIVDNPKLDKAKSTFNIDVPKGTLMIVSQFTDLNYYNSVVANGQVGYSIEGFLGLKLSEIIDKQKNKFTMENKPTNLPEGTKFEIDGVKYIVTGGVILKDESIDVPADATAVDSQLALPLDAPAEKVEPVEETAAAVAPPVDAPAPVVDAPVTPTAPTAPTGTADEASILAVIQPKLDEIYKMIADLKAADAAEDATEMPMACQPTKMSIHDRFKQVMEFTKEN